MGDKRLKLMVSVLCLFGAIGIRHHQFREATSATVTTPSSRMPALSHLQIRRMMRLSPTRCSKKLTSQSWLTLPKEGATDYPSPGFSRFGNYHARAPSF